MKTYTIKQFKNLLRHIEKNTNPELDRKDDWNNGYCFGMEDTYNTICEKLEEIDSLVNTLEDSVEETK